MIKTRKTKPKFKKPVVAKPHPKQAKVMKAAGFTRFIPAGSPGSNSNTIFWKRGDLFLVCIPGKAISLKDLVTKVADSAIFKFKKTVEVTYGGISY